MLKTKNEILFVNGHLNSGGVEKSLVELLKQIDYNLYSVDLLLFEDKGDYLNEIPEHVNIIFKDATDSYGGFFQSIKRCIKNRNKFALKLRLISVLSKFFGKKTYKFLGRDLCKNKKYDCAVAYRSGFCTDIVAYSINSTKKITWWHHGEFNVDAGDYNNVCKKIDTVVSVSECCKKMIADNCPDLNKKIVVIPNMVDAEAINLMASKFNPYKEYVSDTIHFVSVCRLSPEKHIENAIECAKMIRESNDIDFVWHIVGDGNEKAKLEQLAYNYNLQNVIRFEGNQKNPYPYIKFSDYFVHTSYIESQGLSVLEALALGVPCVATKSSGVLEYLKNGFNAAICEQNVNSLYESILAMVENKDNLDQIIYNAKTTVYQFSPEFIINSFYKIL